MSERFKGKVVWISGAAQGIGRGIAEYFASEGASVAMADIKEEAGKSLASEICGKGGDATFFWCDVNDEASVKHCIEQTVSRYDGIHIMINNAAVNIIRSLHEYSSEEWDWQM